MVDFQRLELYHELRHYKIQLYNDLRDEVLRLTEYGPCVPLFENAKKVKEMVFFRRLYKIVLLLTISPTGTCHGTRFATNNWEVFQSAETR